MYTGKTMEISSNGKHIINHGYPDGLTQQVDSLRELVQHLIKSQEERTRWQSRELHTQTGQIMTQLTLMLYDLKSCLGEKAGAADEAIAVVQKLSAEISRICQDPGTGMLEHIGLVETLDWLFNRFREETGIFTEYRNSGEDAVLPLSAARAALRIAEEFLALCPRNRGNGAVKQAAEHVIESGILTLDLSGEGFGVADIARARLSLIKEQAIMAGGGMEVKSPSPSSLRLHVILPLGD